MLSVCRRFTRPFTLLLLAVLVGPAAVDCCELTGAHAEELACCLKQDDARPVLEADCCAITESPATQQVPGSTPVGTDKPTQGGISMLTVSWLAVPAQVSALPVADVIRPPADPLYLRLSTLRR